MVTTPELTCYILPEDDPLRQSGSCRSVPSSSDPLTRWVTPPTDVGSRETDLSRLLFQILTPSSRFQFHTGLTTVTRSPTGLTFGSYDTILKTSVYHDRSSPASPVNHPDYSPLGSLTWVETLYLLRFPQSSDAESPSRVGDGTLLSSSFSRTPRVPYPVIQQRFERVRHPVPGKDPSYMRNQT